MDELARKLPCSTESERVVLGAVIVGHPQSCEVFDLLEAEDFNDSRHQLIFRTLKRMWEAGQAVELGSLSDELSAEQKLESVGGVGLVGSLGEGVYNRMRIDKYAAEIRSSRVAREFIKAANVWTDDAFTGKKISQILDSVRERVATLANLHAVKDNGTNFKEASAALIASLYEEHREPLSCGIPEVDDRSGGFRAGELGIITADTGVGKTFFALQIARKSCAAGHHLLYCSGEMLAQHLMGRVLSSVAGISYTKIRKPQLLSNLERNSLMEFALKQCPECRVVDGELSLPRIRAAARDLKGKFGGVIVDYDELVDVRGKDEFEQQRVLVRSLKSLAMELEIPVIVVSQLRKALNPEERKNPTLQRLYGSGAKAKHASVVLYVDRPFVQNLTGDESVAALYILKSRDGRMGKTDCLFNVKTLSFQQVNP
jgi:replicative DNA helicase